MQTGLVPELGCRRYSNLHGSVEEESLGVELRFGGMAIGGRLKHSEGSNLGVELLMMRQSSKKRW
jgi:hypothetical protein